MRSEASAEQVVGHTEELVAWMQSIRVSVTCAGDGAVESESTPHFAFFLALPRQLGHHVRQRDEHGGRGTAYVQSRGVERQRREERSSAVRAQGRHATRCGVGCFGQRGIQSAGSSRATHRRGGAGACYAAQPAARARHVTHLRDSIGATSRPIPGPTSWPPTPLPTRPASLPS